MTHSTATSKSTARKPLVGTKFGVVVSDKRQKTRKVRVDYMTKHPKYGKFIRRQTTFQVHDEQNLSKGGDQVEIAPCRPMSKTKSWRLVRVVQAAAAKEAVAQ